MQAARLPRDVPEKAEAFLRVALCAASDELLIFCSVLCMVGRARPAKGFVFSDPSRSGYGWLARRCILLIS
jgi:hypothetical protein